MYTIAIRLLTGEFLMSGIDLHRQMFSAPFARPIIKKKKKKLATSETHFSVFVRLPDTFFCFRAVQSGPSVRMISVYPICPGLGLQSAAAVPRNEGPCTYER
jgi:hypothetical protein